MQLAQAVTGLTPPPDLFPEPGPLAGRSRLTDPRLISGVAEITEMIAAQLDDGANAAEVMPVIRETARRWLERQVRAGLLPASAGGRARRAGPGRARPALRARPGDRLPA